VALDPAGLMAWLRSQLSSFKVPRRIHLIGEDAVAWLPSQKVDLRAIKALADRLEGAADRVTIPPG
jgi:hypothetical protein